MNVRAAAAGERKQIGKHRISHGRPRDPAWEVVESKQDRVYSVSPGFEAEQEILETSPKAVWWHNKGKSQTEKDDSNQGLARNTDKGRQLHLY